MRRFGLTLTRSLALFVLLAGAMLSDAGGGVSLLLPPVSSAAPKTFAETWQVEVEITRFDPPFISPDPSVNIPEARFAFLTVIGTVTNISKEPVMADPVAELRLRDGQDRTYTPAGYNETTPAYLPTFNPDVVGDFAAGFPVPLEAEEFRLVSTDGSLDLALPKPTDPTPTVTAQDQPRSETSTLGLGPPIMAGVLGDFWELDQGDDSFWWAAADFGWVDSPSPRYVAEPQQGYWFVVAIDLGTYDGWISSDFPYGLFAVEDRAGNVYFPDLTATNAYCDLYCDMDIEQQDFSGWVGHTFHQAIVFDVPSPTDPASIEESGLTLRTLDGVIAVPLGTAIYDADRTLTIYTAECPVGYVGDASADECDANPVSSVPFQIGLPFTDAFTDFVVTDNEGLVIFDIENVALDGTLRVIESVPSGTEQVVVYCVDESNDALAITYVDYLESNPDIGVVDVAVGTTGDILCDWYNVPEAG